MRTGPVLLISAIAHGVLLVLVAPTRSRQQPFVIPALPMVPPRVETIEVVMLEEAVAEEPTAKTRSTPRSERKGRSSSTSTHSASGLGALRVLAVDPSGSEAVDRSGSEPSGLMRMRGGTDLGLDADVAERIAAAGGPPGREAHRSGRVERRRDGSAVVYDAVTTMEIEPDGTVNFHDKPDIDLKFKWPVPTWDFDVDKLRRDLGKELTDWQRDPYAATRVGRTQDLSRLQQAVPGECDKWGNVWCDDPAAPEAEKKVRRRKQEAGGILGGNFDISAWLHRKFVGDPYASRKLKLLADTVDERVEMGGAYRAKHLGNSREVMRQNLINLWRRVADPKLRRAALFELWDECGEEEGPLGEAGAKARIVVIDWIREYLPAGSPDAFTDEELAAFAARRTSRTPFAPYAQQPVAPVE